MDAFHKVQSWLGPSLTQAAQSFYRKPRQLRHLQPATRTDLTRLKHLYPAAPARFLPLFGISCGDSLGLYCPRGHEPFVAGFDHEESILIPISTDADGLFRNPDEFCFNDPADPMRSFRKNHKVRASLSIKAGAGKPELELLKPFALHYRALERCDPDLFGRLIKRFRSEALPGRLIREAFGDVTSLHDRRRWLRLASRLAREGFSRNAIEALENCHVLHFIYPFYGEPYRKNPSPTWSKVLEVLEQLHPLVEEYGDEFDRATTAHKLKLAKQWAKKE